MENTLEQLLQVARQASSHASQEILKIYESEDFDINLKSDDSPLTKADKKGHEIICNYLEKTGIPILSEEGQQIPFNERKSWNRLWVVDPLDGTKEFIKRNGEFTVNIALIKDNKPIMGVVEAPALGRQYYGIKGKGAFKVIKERNFDEALESIPTLDLRKRSIKVVASRSHLNSATEAFMAQLSDPQVVSMGSSLKFILVAEGDADIYPRFAPTMEWDTAAAHAIISSLNGRVEDVQGNELTYNKKDLLNPYFKVY